MLRLLLIFITCSIFLTGCQSLSEAGKVIRNEKINSNDEFLIKKKEPLTLPPDFDKLLEPNETSSKAENSKSLEQILKVKEKVKIKKKLNSSTEKTIIDEIKNR